MGRKPLFTIGRVTGTHGLKGYVKVQSFAESVSVFKAGMKLNARIPGEATGTWYEILKASPYKKGVRILFKDVDINNAESLIGKELLAARENFYSCMAKDDSCMVNDVFCSDDAPAFSELGLEDDTYFWEDLIGLSVIDLKEGYLGKITSVIATGSNDVFIVQGGKREVLVPGLKSVVLAVDFDKNEMKIDLPEGL